MITAIDGTLEYFRKPSSQQWFPYLDITHERSIYIRVKAERPA